MRGMVAAPGLPFAGIPPEVLAGSTDLLKDEPDYSDLSIGFSHIPPTDKPFTLWQFLAPYKFRMLGALLLLALTESLLLIGPYLVKIAIDDGIMRGDGMVLIWVAVGYLGSLAVGVVVSGFRIRYVGKLGQLLMYQLRLRVFAHLQRLSLDFLY